MKLRICALALSLATAALAQLPPPVNVTVKTLIPGGGRVDWCPANGLIAFDRKGANGVYELCTCKADGTAIKVLSATIPGLPGKNVGQPAWSPDGKYLLFQAEKATHQSASAEAAVPAQGVYNDLWVLDVKTNKARLLRQIPDAPECALQHAHFSPNGKKLAWAEMYDPPRRGGQREFGLWWLLVADVQAGPSGLTISNVRKFQPGGPAFYEAHGFSPDGKTLIYTSNNLSPSMPLTQRQDICTYEFAFDRQLRLTGTDYNEHGQYRPDGKKVAWMTNTGIAGRDDVYRGTDYWLMDADGKNKQRLTYFNDPQHSLHREGTTICSDLSWNAKGTAFVGYRKTFTADGKVSEDVVLVEVK